MLYMWKNISFKKGNDKPHQRETWRHTMPQILNPNGPELLETLKVRGEGQMARTSIFSFLAGP